MKCKVCKREGRNEYCAMHEKASANIKQKFVIWENAADMSWQQYLNEIIKNPFTGIWAKEVAEHLLNDKE